jgi:plasmid stability protein
MPDLLIRGLDEALLAQLQGAANREGLSLEDWARRALEAVAGKPSAPDAAELLRALRAAARPDPSWNSAAEIRAEREARTARILGEDPEEAWARGYMSALDPGKTPAGAKGDAA